MYRQEIEQPFLGEAAEAVDTREIRRTVKAVVDAVGNVLAAIAEPFRGPKDLELLNPKVRAGMTEQEKGMINAYFHSV